MLDDFMNVQRDLDDARKPRRTHPKGWEPGVDTARGVLVVEGGDQPPSDWAQIISELGLDPNAWTVDESQPVQVRSWDSGDKRCYYYRAAVVPTTSTQTSDIDELVRIVKKKRYVAKVAEDLPDRALVVALADWQTGKGNDEQTGTELLLERLWSLYDLVPQRIRDLKKIGKPVNHLVVVGMGDMVESCDGHYAMQSFQVELDMRQQMRLVRRMLVEMISNWSREIPDVVVGCVPGNHGQRRKNGKAFTTFGDNADVEVFEVVKEIFANNDDAYGHIRWAVPDQEQTITIEIAGTVIGFAHGHQFTGGSGVQGKALNWWRNMAMNRTSIGDADILVSGHYHHLQVHGEGVADSGKGRTWMQAPALDVGSLWWEHQGGAPTQHGTLTFVVDQNGWSDLEILR